MSIVVNPHNKQEELALLAFLDRRKYEYARDEDSVLSKEQQLEVLERDRQYEAGETESFTLNEIIAHFDIKEK
ncbi:hypothetical protein [Mucilaginibacter sp. OK098]|uniref:hypothetical protein n=1 Tax=Mucilaginibacter sp. OK098 TaxID=1855297 RepID=UPI0009125F52|nr:hypothetical protein [Mucilaginibacter sp. OK098]SHN12856.1 hypothetical protein SAMN05216524_105445 [Mucilaginibacter sp. OK098]